MMIAIIGSDVVKNTGKTTVLGMNSFNIQKSKPQTSPERYKQNFGCNQKKSIYGNLPFGQQPISVVRRNARERNRVKLVNNGFVTLRQHIPPNVIQALSNGGRGPQKKLSKVDTLRLAVEYIRRLQDLVSDLDVKKSLPSTSFSEITSSSFDQILTASNFNTSSYYSPQRVLSQQEINQFHFSSTPMSVSNSNSQTEPNHSVISNSPTPSYVSETLSLSPNSQTHNVSGLSSINHCITDQNKTKIKKYVYKFKPNDIYSTTNQHYNQCHSNISVNASKTDDEDILDYITMWQEEQQ